MKGHDKIKACSFYFTLLPRKGKSIHEKRKELQTINQGLQERGELIEIRKNESNPEQWWK